MDLLSCAVSNNVDWCALVCTGGGVTYPTAGLWLATGSPPPLFPDAVTLKSGVSVMELVEVISGRHPCSVKDSYADVDLAPYGFTELFTAEWIGQTNAPIAVGRTDWSVVTEPAELECWCAAAELPEGLPVGLLHDPSVRILGAYREGRLTAGAVANNGHAVAGLSNVFQIGGGTRWVWREVASAVARFFPGQPVVGYEHGPDLDAALAADFSNLGPLRVWLRSPTPDRSANHNSSIDTSRSLLKIRGVKGIQWGTRGTRNFGPQTMELQNQPLNCSHPVVGTGVAPVTSRPDWEAWVLDADDHTTTTDVRHQPAARIRQPDVVG